MIKKKFTYIFLIYNFPLYDTVIWLFFLCYFSFFSMYCGFLSVLLCGQFLWQMKRRLLTKLIYFFNEGRAVSLTPHQVMWKVKHFYIFGMGVWDISSSPLPCNCVHIGLTWHVIANEWKRLSNERELKRQPSQPSPSIGISFTAYAKDVQMDLTWITAMPGASQVA